MNLYEFCIQGLPYTFFFQFSDLLAMDIAPGNRRLKASKKKNKIVWYIPKKSSSIQNYPIKSMVQIVKDAWEIVLHAQIWMIETFFGDG